MKRDLIIENLFGKGDCLLRFDRLEFNEDCYHDIDSLDKLSLVLDYLLRIGNYKEYAKKTVINNIYMAPDKYYLIERLKRAKTQFQREIIKQNVLIRAKRLKLEFGKHKIVTENVKCYFDFDEDDIQKYKFKFGNFETFAFPVSNHYLKGLYRNCDKARSHVTDDNLKFKKFSYDEFETINLLNIKDSLIKALLLDDINYEKGEFIANMSSVLVLQ